MLASDSDGQATLTAPSELEIDGQPPKVTVARWTEATRPGEGQGPDSGVATGA